MERKKVLVSCSLVVRVLRYVVVDCASGSSALNERLSSHLISSHLKCRNSFGNKTSQ